MLENILKKVRTKIAACVLAGALLFNSGCMTYRNSIPADSIPSVESSEEDTFYMYERMTSEESIKAVKTPKQVLDYFTQKMYYKNENNSIEKGEYQSFKANHIDRKGVCFDYAMSAAALLSDNGYPPLVLILMGKPINHSVFLFKQNDSYYALGNTSTYPEKSSTIEELADKLSPQNTVKSKWEKYVIINLDEVYPDRKWINGDVINGKFFITDSTSLAGY
ncbi:MAG: hypothetical protein M1416_03435 [Candidatus Pacearchaeota archaeon]|nr:hypothetical protein [Candidatus Pacearchaeota archaeon]